MAVLVSFRKYREDAGSVEYLFGFDHPVRRLRFDKASRRPKALDGSALCVRRDNVCALYLV